MKSHWVIFNRDSMAGFYFRLGHFRHCLRYDFDRGKQSVAVILITTTNIILETHCHVPEVC